MPPAYAEVDVKLDDNGEKINCFMLAGMVGGRISSSADPMLSSSGENDTVHPVPRWWICTKKQNVVSAQEEEEAHLEEIMRDFEERRKKRGEYPWLLSLIPQCSDILFPFRSTTAREPASLRNESQTHALDIVCSLPRHQ
jgi:hypothetical protein